MGDLVTLRPVTEDDLAFLASLRDGPAATGVHEWHGWSDPQRRRRQWAETGLLGENGGTLIVRHDADRVGHVVPDGNIALVRVLYCLRHVENEPVPLVVSRTGGACAAAPRS